MTESLEPFSFYAEDGSLRGVCVDLMRALLKRVDHVDNIEVLPWDRAYWETQTLPDRILIGVGRSEAREHLFHWVGPLLDNATYFYKQKGSNVNLRSFDDARKVESIAVRQNYFAHSLLDREGFKNLFLTRDEAMIYLMLVAGRADLIAAGEWGLKPTCSKLEIDCTRIENTGVKVYDSKLYLAFSKSTSVLELERWQKALEALRDDPVYHDIVQSYGH
ncbi:MAG: transporter substrate-binding domain-containing protein [Pseudomonadales bacterium]|nr:transporter substrate-binding domain-containing protein [Pseudomonadales bacterium]